MTDVFYHMSDSEFRQKNGEIVGFIPDNSNEICDTIGTKVGDIAGNDLAGVIASVNNDNRISIWTNENYIEWFVRRINFYNYTIENNNEYRELVLLIPLNRIFSFCDEVNRLLKYILFEIVLTKSGNNSHC